MAYDHYTPKNEPITKPQPSRAEVWAMFAAAALPVILERGYDNPERTYIGICNTADNLIAEYDKRWSDDNANT